MGPLFFINIIFSLRMNILLKKRLYILLFTLIPPLLTAQEVEKQLKEQPGFQLFRADEDYAYLKNREAFENDFTDPIKYIPFNKKGNMFHSLGGQIRSRFEHFGNRFWVEDKNENFYSQRAAIYSNLVLGRNLRVYTEFYSGFTSGENEFAQDDDLAIFQAFVDYYMHIADNKKLQLRLGRQELGLGASRLVGIREGPNIRRSFDMGKLQYMGQTFSSMAYYGKEVIPEFGAFDNSFSLSDSDAPNSSLWGLNQQFDFSGTLGKIDIFYLGFKNGKVTFNDVSGSETRHTIGIRRYGALGKRKNLLLDAEVVYQFGDLANEEISAWGYTINASYQFIGFKSKPKIGLKLEYTSGDEEPGDGKVQSYNPMFVNPAFYSLAATIAPVNIISIHPYIEGTMNRVRFYAEWAVFWRNSVNDAVYRPTRFILITSDGHQSRSIGHQLGLKSSYEISRHLSFDLDISYFVAGDFLVGNKRNNNNLHLAPTASFKF